MYGAKVMIKLAKDESDALLSLAKQERRDPRAQAAVIIRRELERLGLLTTSINPPVLETRRER